MTVLTIRRSGQEEAGEMPAGEMPAADKPAAVTPRWANGTWQRFRTPDKRILALSICLQLVLALLLGHSYDMRIFMATGYLVGSGQNPYVAQDLTAVFHHINFAAISTVGYPPPWPLVLGLLYRSVYATCHSFLVYNLAIKIPVVAANIGLAYLVGAILQNVGARTAVARKAWIFLLLNPFLLYFGAAWGQIDAIVALFALAALVLLFAGRRGGSAVLLALAVSFKPTALPILPVALIWLWGSSSRQTLRYAAVFLGGALLFCVAPFFIFGWSPNPIFRHWNAHFEMTGTMSYMTIARLFRDPLVMSGDWWLLGMVWIPALALGIAALRRGDGGLADLLKKSTALALIFFLTRTWLAEPNVVLVLPLVLVLTSIRELDRRALTAVWVIPLVFTVFNASPLELLFVSWPETMRRTYGVAADYHSVSLAVRAALAIAWQIAGWWIVVNCYRHGPPHPSANAEEGLAA